MLADALRVGTLRLEGVAVPARDEGTTAALNREAARLRSAYEDLAVGSIPGVRAARELYHAIGLDPTKTRPSSEALLRRALRRKPMPAVNGAVDAANLVSLTLLLPVGLYDADAIRGEVEIRRGRPEEGYRGVDDGEVRLAGRIAVCDDDGPFGNPTRDSRRTCVTGRTTSLRFLLFAPAAAGSEALRAALARAEATFTRAVGGEAVETGIVP